MLILCFCKVCNCMILHDNCSRNWESVRLMKLLEDSDGFPQMEQDEPKAQRFLQWMWYDVNSFVSWLFLCTPWLPSSKKYVEPPKVGKFRKGIQQHLTNKMQQSRWAPSGCWFFLFGVIFTRLTSFCAGKSSLFMFVLASSSFVGRYSALVSKSSSYEQCKCM